MATFLTYRQPIVAVIDVHRYDSSEHGINAIVGFRDERGVEHTAFQIDDPGIARQLLAAGAGACRIVRPTADQIREVNADLALLVAELDAEKSAHGGGGEDEDEDDGDPLNDQTAPYWPAAAWNPAWGMS